MKKLSFLLILSLLTVSLMIYPIVAVTWSAENRLTDFRSIEGLPTIAQMSDGKIWVAFESNIRGTTDIVYRVYDGLSWGNPQLLTLDENNDISPSLIKLSNGTICLFFASDRTGNYDVFYKTSSNNGQDWSNEIQLTTNPNDDYAPSALQTQDGKIWFTWERTFPGPTGPTDDIFYRFYDGSSWSGEFQLTTDPNRDQVPSITQMRDGRIWVAWCSYRTGDFEIFYKIYDGASWSSEIRRTFSTDIDIDPAILQTRDGVIWIVWTSAKPSGTDDLFYITSADNGETWSAASALTSNAADDMWSSLAQINDKKLWVVFTSNRLDNFDIYYKTSDEIIIHDVAITSVSPASSVVDKGATLPIDIGVENQGDNSETFTVSCYAESLLIGSQPVTLAGTISTTLTFLWDTTTYNPGTYTIKATASVVPSENPINTYDNTLIDGGVIVAVHDVSIIGVSTSVSTIAQGQIVKIKATVKNEGNVQETFQVTAYYDSTAIETKEVKNLGPSASKVLTFNWNTSSAELGTYVVSVSAPSLPAETDTADNSYSDGTVKVKLPGDVDDDRDVDIMDMALVARALGTDPAWPPGMGWDQWNPEADFNGDLRVDVVDLFIAGKNFGRTT